MIEDFGCVTLMALDCNAVPISVEDNLASFVSLRATTAAWVIRVSFVTRVPCSIAL